MVKYAHMNFIYEVDYHGEGCIYELWPVKRKTENKHINLQAVQFDL